MIKKRLSGLFVLCIGLWGYSQASTSTRLWDTSLIEDSETITQLINYDISSVYLQIDTNISFSQYLTFIKQCNKNDISVYALDGSPDWTLNKNASKSLIIWVAKYNMKHSKYPFAGIHLDVEPYLLDARDNNQSRIVSQYQSLVSTTMSLAKKKSLKVYRDIPFWFDSIDSPIKGNLAKWMISKVSGVTIMAYRNTSDALLPLIKDEINYTNSAKKPITIGLETNKSSEGSQVSFYGMKVSQLEDVTSDILDKYPSVDIAIHDYSGIIDLDQ